MAVAVMIVHLRHHGTTLNPDVERQYKAISAKFPGSLVESDKLWASRRQTGADTGNIAALLKSQGVAARLAETPDHVALTPDVTKLRNPAVFLWGWYPHGIRGQRHGGHFTVAARVTKAGKIVILNPWYGRLDEVAPGHHYQHTGILDAAIYT